MSKNAAIDDFVTMNYENGAPCIFRKSQVEEINNLSGNLYNIKMKTGREFTIKANKKQIIQLDIGAM